MIPDRLPALQNTGLPTFPDPRGADPDNPGECQTAPPIPWEENVGNPASRRAHIPIRPDPPNPAPKPVCPYSQAAIKTTLHKKNKGLTSVWDYWLAGSGLGVGKKETDGDVLFGLGRNPGTDTTLDHTSKRT